MKKIAGLLIISCVALLTVTGCRTASPESDTAYLRLQSTGPGDTFIVRVTGTKGLRFEGFFVVDGEQQAPIEGRVPAEFTVKANSLTANFRKKGNRGQIRLEVKNQGNTVTGGAANINPRGGVRAEVNANGRQESSFSAF